MIILSNFNSNRILKFTEIIFVIFIHKIIKKNQRDRELHILTYNSKSGNRL